MSIIPIKLLMTSVQNPQPQAIFVLGGHPDREVAAAQLAKYYPKLDVWVSSGSLPEVVKKTFDDSGIGLDRLHLDFLASDTVTNFTTMVPVFEMLGLKHVWLVTSDFHMRRARAIAFTILGSRGITYTPLAVPSNRPQESRLRVGRDVARSVLWIITQRTGRELSKRWDYETD